MKIDVDHNKVQLLLKELNSKLFLLEGERKSSVRQLILDSLLEEEESPIKELARILGVKI